MFSLVAMVCIWQGFDWILLFPFLILILFLGFFRLNQLILLTVFLTPLSINLSETPLGFGISLPAEPLIFGLMLLTLLKIVFEGGIDKKILLHPVSLLILLHLFWFVVTTITSTMLLVSIKYTLARFWFVLVFFYLCAYLFKDIKNIYRFIWCYVIPLLLVIAYSTYRHAGAGFTEEAAHISMTPFYNDHTAYAAGLTLFFPVILILVFQTGLKWYYRFLIFSVASAILYAIIYSYTRAAWVGLVVAFLAFLTFLFKINYKIVLIGMVSFLILIGVSWTNIMIKLEANRKQSSTEYASHLQSISNISTDASNVERINRWSSAFRMFMEKPILGWGPGTYQFKYAPFQQFNEKTIISTNAGNRGNAHSEYIGPLAEQGIFGFVTFALVIITVIIRSARLIKTTSNRKIKTLALGLLLGLITYWIHGFLNYFLDSDKASVPFWGFIAALTALELFHNTKAPIQPST